MNGEIFGVLTLFGRDDYGGTAQPRAETKLRLCAYTVLQSVSSLPCLCGVSLVPSSLLPRGLGTRLMRSGRPRIVVAVNCVMK